MGDKELRIMDKIRLKSIDEYIKNLDRAIMAFSAALFTFEGTDKYDVCLSYLGFYLDSRAEYFIEILRINRRLED